MFKVKHKQKRIKLMTSFSQILTFCFFDNLKEIS